MDRKELDSREDGLGAAAPVAILLMFAFVAVSATDLSLPWSAITTIGDWQIVWGPAIGLVAGALLSGGRSVLATLAFGLSVLLDALSMGGSGLAEVMNIQWSNVLGGFAALWAVGGGHARLGRGNWVAFGLVGAAISVPVVLHADLVDLTSYVLVPASWASLAAGRAFGGRLQCGSWHAPSACMAVLGAVLVMALYGQGVMEQAASVHSDQGSAVMTPAEL